jgi:oxygen-independent coproporphyrinogen-3 oxidase
MSATRSTPMPGAMPCWPTCATKPKLAGGEPLESVFFGGGTPSLMPPALVAALLVEAERLWGFAPDIEITLEANPSSVEAANFAELAAAGSTACRSGCRRSTTQRCVSRPAAHAQEGWQRSTRAKRIRARQLRPDLRRPGPDAGQMAAELTARSASAPGTCRSTS